MVEYGIIFNLISDYDIGCRPIDKTIIINYKLCYILTIMTISLKIFHLRQLVL